MKKVLMACAVAGFAGAAVFYSPSDLQLLRGYIVCPLCPIICGPFLRTTGWWIRMTMTMGSVNAALFCCVVLAVIGSYRLAKWIRAKRSAGGRGAVPA